MLTRKSRSLNEMLRVLEDSKGSYTNINYGQLFMQKKLETTDALENEAKKILEDLTKKTLDLSKQSAQFIDQYTHQKPWVTVGIFAVVAGILGFILGRKNNHRR